MIVNTKANRLVTFIAVMLACCLSFAGITVINLATQTTGILLRPNGGTGVSSTATFPTSGTVATVPTCTNQVAVGNGTTLSCTSVTSSIVDTTVAKVIARGTSTFTTTAVASGACQTTVTTAATNAATTDAIDWSYATAPVTATDVRLIVQPWTTTNNVNFARCNPTASSITPSAIVINWQVKR
jgi:hypothetical protein